MLVRITGMRRDIPRLPGRAGGAIRERKTSIWVCCPRCNVIALAIAEIEMQ